MEPTFGVTENPRSVIAPANASQLIDPRAVDDLDSSDENMLKVEVLTLNISGTRGGFSSEEASVIATAWGLSS